jgi:hypothetical protein
LEEANSTSDRNRIIGPPKFQADQARNKIVLPRAMGSDMTGEIRYSYTTSGKQKLQTQLRF